MLKGPLDYKTEKKHKIPGSYTFKTEKGQFMNEVSYLSQQSPAANTYNPQPELRSEMKRSPKAHLNRCASERPILMPFKKNDSPSPLSYSVERSWKRLSHVEEIGKPFTISKEKASNYLDVLTKQKAFIPGVAKYDLSDKRMSMISKGYIPHYKRGR